MAVGLFALTLAMALVFMLYVLANFWFEAKRPRRNAPHLPNGVIAFREGLVGPGGGAKQRRQTVRGNMVSHAEKSDSEMTVPALPSGLVRVAVKRAVRS